jgi:hypothetical protein
VAGHSLARGIFLQLDDRAAIKENVVLLSPLLSSDSTPSNLGRLQAKIWTRRPRQEKERTTPPESLRAGFLASYMFC